MLDSVHNLYLPAFSTEFDNNYNGEWVIVYQIFSSFLFLPNLAVLMYKRETIQSPLHKQSLQTKLFIKKVCHCYIINQLFKKKG